MVAAAAAKSLQSCPTLCDPIDGSPPGSRTPGILQGCHFLLQVVEEKVFLPFPTSLKELGSCQVLGDGYILSKIITMA